MYKIACAVLGIAVISTAAANAQEQKNTASYYCKAVASGGIAYNKFAKNWQGTVFTLDNIPPFVLHLKFIRSYLHKKATALEDDEMFSVYEVTMTDSGTSFATNCTQDDNKEIPMGRYNTIFCSRALVDYKINLNTNRYLETYAVGYFVGNDDNSDTPAITGGFAQKLSEDDLGLS